MLLAFYFLLIYFNVNAKSHSYSLPLPTWTSINNTVTKALCNMFLRKLLKIKPKKNSLGCKPMATFYWHVQGRGNLGFFWCRTVMTMHGVLYNSMDYVIILIRQ